MLNIQYKSHTIKERLEILYEKSEAEVALKEINALIKTYKTRVDSKEYHLSEEDTILITYGDQVQLPYEPPLQTLNKFLDNYLKGIINSVHILPFYPYSSDDGFSVINYSEVDPKMGSWNEVEGISKDYRLMVDGVINHISQYSDWFKGYLAGEAKYDNYFIDLDPITNLSEVVRPRASPLLSEFTDKDGKIHNIWTTFSKDQVDLNYANYKVLISVLDALFQYVEKGATLIRLDAIAFIWKEVGTPCVHLAQTHELIQLMREVLHKVAPEVIMITETNVPHDENISYFGSGSDEAQMVYNFALPPLLAHSVLQSDTKKLTTWAKTLSLPSDKVCFFNFTASHDGCGLRPVSGLLSDEELDYLVQNTQEHGGLVSFRDTPEGKKPYELNCSFIDILSHPDEEDSIKVKRMLLTQAVALAMPGVPGIYFHSLVGSHNYHEGVKLSGVNRTINREKFNYDRLVKILESDGSMEKIIFSAYRRLISIRTHEKAFNPHSKFAFYDFHKSVFAIFQESLDKSESILALHNFSNKEVDFDLGDDFDVDMNDLLSNKTVSKREKVKLLPYQIMWLKN
ncbi:sugar phosphorylase [Sulfurimonas aquatica]|uniref:Sugar phosphorylase n=1 Tax=Sulfurimonas aquatica TaxID=2672570 RepID=A0A975B1W4_9BACT|nr:sugar phosphorylase [Sulfurimonas aquatica]QSZ42674.1 sugar phosphorylase [Sulfurimonas aquatica]